MLATEQLVTQVPTGKTDGLTKRSPAVAATKHEEVHDDDDVQGASNSWSEFWFFRLFFRAKFVVHRGLGMAYLIQYALSLFLYFYSYPTFKSSVLVWSLPMTGVLQSLNASYYFSFLPKTSATHGYFSDKRAITFDFVKENIFFASILFFQFIYYSDEIFSILKNTPIEAAFVFFPYFFRFLFPKTSFRDQLNNPRNKNDQHYIFFQVTTTITKTFYVWAKHYIGFFMNYVRFLERITPEQQYHMYLLLIFSAFATTISMFLHTLKFKHYIDSRLATIIYIASYMCTFYSFARISSVFFTNIDLALITLGGVIVNFTKVEYQYAYQILVCFTIYAMRFDYI